MYPLVYLYAVLAWILVILTSPVLTPTLLIALLVRSIVVFLSRLLRSDLIEPIKDLELSFCADDFYKRPLGSNAFVWILEGPIDTSVLLKRIEDLMVDEEGEDYARFISMYPTTWLNFPFWCRTKNFSLSNHVKIEESKRICDEDELTEFICGYLQSPFENEKPCWDILYVSNYGFSGEPPRSVFIFRCHHIVGDGLSMLKFLEAISDCAETRPAKMVDKTAKRVPMFENIQYLFYAPLMLLHQIKEFGVHSDALAVKKSTQEVTLSLTTFPYKRLQELREPFKCAGNGFPTIAAYNWILSGTLCKYFEKELGKSHEDLKGATNLIASLPIRTTTDNRTQKFQNIWTHGIFRLPLDQPCSAKRKQMIVENCKWISRLNAPKVFRFLLPFQRLLPYGVIKSIVSSNMGAPVGLTNLAGPTVPIYLGGQKVINKFAIVGLQWPHASLSCGFFSYNGTLSVSLLGNKDTIGGTGTSKRILNTYFHEELECLAPQKCDQTVTSQVKPCCR